MSYSDQLASLNTQIALAEAGSEKSVAGRSIKRDLVAMYAERRRLEPLASREANGGLSVSVATRSR